jgi:probable phosphomutase (TIGR03848 family)
MTTALMVAHGRTTIDPDVVMSGWIPDVHLDSVGREESEAAAIRLAEVRYSTLLTSPIEACRATAEIISRRRRRDLPTHTELGIAECRFGDWTGRPMEVLRKEPLWEVLRHHPSAMQFPGGESLVQMQARALQSVRDWNRKLGAGKTYVMVTHPNVIQSLLADALGMHLDLFHRIEVDPSSVSVIKYGPIRPVVARVNDKGGDLSTFSPARSRR